MGRSREGRVGSGCRDVLLLAITNIDFDVFTFQYQPSVASRH